MDIVHFSRECEKKSGVKIPAFPVGIEYRGEGKYPKAYVTVGDPVELSNPDIENIVFNEIKRLSGL